MEIKESTTTNAWKAALRYIIDDSREEYREKRQRTCSEVLNLRVTVENPSFDVTTPIEILNSFQKWVYPPLSEISNVIFSKHQNPIYEYSYGSVLFKYQGVLNQIDDYIIPLLKQNPNSRRGVVFTWDPIQHSNKFKQQVPGLTQIDFKLRNGKLNITSIVRSNDMFFGWPANVYQIFLLQEYVKLKLGCELGTLTTFSTSAHIFDDQKEHVKQVINR
ncbi:hypothetical protein HN587_02405 [Candidatus Woesearchaeota archaeon]|jgi:thymidylate synthase|nr:hypothetical protein [Candidatus Woesearchaeota archaeon]